MFYSTTVATTNHDLVPFQPDPPPDCTLLYNQDASHPLPPPAPNILYYHAKQIPQLYIIGGGKTYSICFFTVYSVTH